MASQNFGGSLVEQVLWRNEVKRDKKRFQRVWKHRKTTWRRVRRNSVASRRGPLRDTSAKRNVPYCTVQYSTVLYVGKNMGSGALSAGRASTRRTRLCCNSLPTRDKKKVYSGSPSANVLSNFSFA